MAFSKLENRFRIPDKSAKAPSRVFDSIQSDMQFIRDSLTVLNVFISPFEEVFPQMIDPMQLLSVASNQPTASQEKKSES